MYNHKVLTTLAAVSVAASCCLSLVAAPTDFDPLKPMLGKWTGHAEVVTSDNSDNEPVRYTKISECKITEAGDTFLMVDTEVNPWTKKKYTTTAVIKRDHSSDTFKAMVTGSDGSVRLFVIRVSGNTLHYDLVDRPADVEFKSKVQFQDNGTLVEEGYRTGTQPKPYTVKWTVQYTRQSTSESDPQAATQ